MNAIYYVCILVAGTALAQAKHLGGCGDGTEAPSCYDITQATTDPDVEDIDCRNCFVRAVAQMVTDPTVHLPHCVFGKFVPHQYDPTTDQSYCVHPRTGVRLPNTLRSGRQNITTHCEEHLRNQGSNEVERPCSTAVVDFTPVCMPDGFYDVKQCDGEDAFVVPRFCWCTTKLGQYVPMSFHVDGTKDAGFCDAFRAFTYNCEGKMGTFQPHPTDCVRYIKCAVSGTFSCTCGHGMAWDTTTGTCNYASDVACTLGQSDHNTPENQPAARLPDSQADSDARPV